ncbi:hypothetical protein CAEBREN_16517 [Caenorhabditis brenneri]|uniref:Uncharacterized protein n=1 Tax=Caenorhabditis brenneri TaxID=135651 RepID=G0PGM2_CAEBE|nr:hypothetical protein CAEBREN_16517 [Caenorhabditis brenneri]
MLTHLIGPLQILLEHIGDHSSILLHCQMAVPLELLLNRAFPDWNHEINYTDVNAMLRQQGQQQILIEYTGEERRGTLQIEDFRAEVRELRMHYHTMN